MTSRTDHGTEATAEREIVNTRLLSAPRVLVFQAFSNPSHLARWWGPKGFTNTFGEFDLRPDGHWRFVMHGPDGTDYPNHSVFVEVVPPERVVFRHLDPMHTFQMSILFGERGGKTELTWRMLFDTVAKCDEVRAFVAEANEQNFDRLETELAEMASGAGASSRQPSVEQP
ncbi:MAG: hypothetical protein QOE70_1755 [Chthoniobacter sp.]|jgi:uncharacterized protein YndB with AHSA1/START domain|nr:hypothetical protein [Chthoniobacter sp.]